MGIMLDLNTLPNNKAVAIVMILATSVLGPFHYIFQFSPDVFAKNNITTLLLLSTSCGIPIVSVNTLFLFYGIAKDYTKESKWPTIGILSSIISMFVIYIPSMFNSLYPMEYKKAFAFSFYIEFFFCTILSISSVYILIKSKHSSLDVINTPAAPTDPLPPSPLPENQSGT